MTVLILATFLIVGAACFFGISKLGKISCGNYTETVCIAVCDMYSALWIASRNIPNIRLYYGSSGEVLSAVKEGRAILGVLAEDTNDSSICAVKSRFHREKSRLVM